MNKKTPKYKGKNNAYFNGVWNGDTNVIVMSKHLTLDGAKARAAEDLKYDKKGKLSIFKYVGDVEVK